MKQRKLPALAAILPQFHLRTAGWLSLLLLALVALPPLNEMSPSAGVSSHVDNSLSQVQAVASKPEAAPVAPPPPPVPAVPANTRFVLEVKSGDSVSKLFKQAGFGPREVDDILSSAPDKSILSAIAPGYQLAFEVTPQQALQSVELVKSPMESFRFALGELGTYEFTPLIRTPEIRLVTKEAVITDSLYMAAQRSGIPARMTMDLNTIFGGVVDFYLDTRKGDTFKIVFEEKLLDGKQVEYGAIVAAEFVNQGKHFRAVRYINEEGKPNFFSPMGESMRKAFLLNPLDYTRISDGFSLARKHPILNTIRAHRGTDYAAPTGTEVKATADGRVTFVGRKGSFGKLVVIQHGARFETKYAHLNGYAKGLKVGDRVSQNQVIGYVGATGSATGPHLHYEFLMDGVHRNSRTIHDQLPLAESIASANLPAFRRQVEPYLKMLDEIKADSPASGKADLVLLEQ